MGRRDLLRLLVGGGMLGWSGYLFKTILWPAPLDPGELATLNSFVDALIPADDMPGALDLGVHEAIAAEAGRDRQLRYLLRRGCDWLDAQARDLDRPAFAACSSKELDAIIRRAAESPRDSAPRVFFERVRLASFAGYYGDPHTWSALGYLGPPQPTGFPDYQLPPS